MGSYIMHHYTVACFEFAMLYYIYDMIMGTFSNPAATTHLNNKQCRVSNYLKSYARSCPATKLPNELPSDLQHPKSDCKSLPTLYPLLRRLGLSENWVHPVCPKSFVHHRFPRHLIAIKMGILSPCADKVFHFQTHTQHMLAYELPLKNPQNIPNLR